MALSTFIDKDNQPMINKVVLVLDDAYTYWESIDNYIKKFGEIRTEWRFYSKKVGWCKKVFLVNGNKERNIVFLYPNQGYFTFVMVFGLKAIEQMSRSDISDEIIHQIESAKEYVEGKSFQKEVHTQEDVLLLQQLIDIKIHS